MQAIRTLLLGMAMVATSALAAEADPLAPRNNAADARVSPLAGVVLGTGDLDATERFYGEAMGMTCSRRRFDGAAARAFRRHYAMAPGGAVETTTCRRGDPRSIAVRAVLVRGTSLARPDHDARITGALSLGFPSSGNAPLDARVTKLGFTSTAGLTSIDLKRTDGSTYRVGEVHYKAPDGVYALGIDRGAMAAVGAIDPAIGVGGPAYSGMMVGSARAARRVLADVLGLEMRRDVQLASSGPNGGLGLPIGTRFQFQQWFTPGTSTGYVIIMELLENGRAAPAPLGLRQRGLGLWTFETQQLDSLLERARRAGVEILAQPRRSPWDEPGLKRSALIATDDGFPIELVETPDPSAAGAATPTATTSPLDPDTCDHRPVIMVVSGLLKDRARLAVYAKAIRDSGLYDRLGGYYLNAPRAVATFEGAPPANASTLLVRFPCLAHARGFWYSTQYQRDIIPLRVAPSAGEFTVTVYAEIAPPAYMAGRLAPVGYAWKPGPDVRNAIPMVVPVPK